MKKTKDTQYLYLSANIRAQENRMVGTQALHKMISAATPEEAYKTVTDAGIGVDVNYQDFESALTQELVSTYERLEKAAPDPEMFKIFRYKYDGHNLKTIIKAQSCGNSTEGLLSPLGTVDEKTLLQGAARRRFWGAGAKDCPGCPAGKGDACQDKRPADGGHHHRPRRFGEHVRPSRAVQEQIPDPPGQRKHRHRQYPFLRAP